VSLWWFVFTFTGSKRAYQAVPKKFSILILGPSGAGKSTIWKLITNKLRHLQLPQNDPHIPTTELVRHKHKVFVQGAARERARFSGWDFPGDDVSNLSEVMTRTMPTEAFVCIPHDRVIDQFGPLTDDGLPCNIHPNDDPIVQWIRGLRDSLGDIDYRHKVSDPWRWHPPLRNIHLLYTKADLVANGQRGAWIQSVLEYYRDTHVYSWWDGHLDMDAIAAKNGAYLPFEAMDSGWRPMTEYISNFININEE